MNNAQFKQSFTRIAENLNAVNAAIDVFKKAKQEDMSEEAYKYLTKLYHSKQKYGKMQNMIIEGYARGIM